VTPAQLNALGRDYLPELFGIVLTSVDGDLAKSVTATLKVSKALMAPNDCLHGGAVMVLGDTVAGYGCIANLPPGATGFLTSEMKANHLSAVREGTVECATSPRLQ
jgi:1,4-dihydroxy-2-naphthoyl-CoA hydrolase